MLGISYQGKGDIFSHNLARPPPNEQFISNLALSEIIHDALVAIFGHAMAMNACWTGKVAAREALQTNRVAHRQSSPSNGLRGPEIEHEQVVTLTCSIVRDEVVVSIEITVSVDSELTAATLLCPTLA